MDAGKAVQAQGAALPGHIARLATSGLAEEAHEDTRTAPDLVADIAQGDRAAELPLYVRVATDLERTAARVAGDAALSREDLHQEGALRLIVDVRAGLVSASFGGAIGPYIGRSLRRHLVDLVDSQRPGRPPIPGRERRRLREALNATANEDETYNTLAAVQYARTRFGWSLAHFWAVHGSAFGAPVQWNDAASSGLSFAETTADPAAAEALARVEDRDDVRRTIEHAELTLRERDVIEAVFGFRGLAATTEETAELLGMSTRHVKRLRASALAKLTRAADAIGVTREHGADTDEPAPEVVKPRAPEDSRCAA
ncbi:sigma-70 family RNA polymerase sigma factor [Amycolatopsis sp. NPDC051071]|uniref:sigma-70 family RNA polymerase sigma factor n=1 Tax=Amycolatopsis sp. NPDC051071 TaxID=3154637 RepID=UPI003442D0A4